MTGSKVLIVKLPELHVDVKALEAFRAYVCDALGAGTLVLPSGTTYAVEEFPPLGAVEVAAEPVPDSGKTAKPPLPDIPAANGVSRPDPKRAESPAETPKQPNAPDKPTPILRSPPARSAAPRSHALPMSESEIVASYRQAAKPAAQITVLADLNVCSKERIEEILREAGEPLPKKAGRAKRTEGAHE